jgi:hypothetical protein
LQRNSSSTQTFPLERLPIPEDWNLYTELEKELGEAKLHLSKHFPCESTTLGEVVRQEEALQHFKTLLVSKAVVLATDNTTAVAYLQELAVMPSFFFAKKFFFFVFYRTFIW